MKKLYIITSIESIYLKIFVHKLNKPKESFIEEIQDTRNIAHRIMTTQFPSNRHLETSRSSPRISSTIQNTLQNPLLEWPSAAVSY